MIRGDILFALAAGVGLIWLLERRWFIAAAVAAVGLVLADRWIEGGALAAFALPAGLFAAKRSALAAAGVAALFAVAQNLWVSPDLPWAALAVLGAPVIAALALRLPFAAPRLPGWAFYAYYPLHLLAILLIFGPYR